MHLLRHQSNGIALHFWLLLVATLPIRIHSSFLQSGSKEPPVLPGPHLDSAAIMRGVDELSLSQNAMVLAGESRKSASTSQHELLGEEALSKTADAYDKIRAMVPEARAQVLKVRKYAMLASQHRDHTEKVEEAFFKIPEVATEQAHKAVLGWISGDASKTAKHASTINTKGDRIAAAVAAAAEPYHLALLRNQKFCEETYAKAKTAQSSSAKLQGDAKNMALKAQELQAAGVGVDARSSFGIATGMMDEAENLRQWSVKLYNQANTACGTAGGYTAAEQQAAANAAATTVVNAPMKLP